MKHIKLSFLIACSILLLVTCSKKDDSSSNTGGSTSSTSSTASTSSTSATSTTSSTASTASTTGNTNFITVDTLTYPVTVTCQTLGTTYSISGTHTTTPVFATYISFPSPPTVTKDYTVALNPSSSSECSINYIEGSDGYSGTTGGTVHVTVSGGSISCSFSNVEVSGVALRVISGNMKCN